jgi:hypothetical protein
MIRKLSFCVLRSIWRAPVLGAGVLVITGHQPMMDEWWLINVNKIHPVVQVLARCTSIDIHCHIQEALKNVNLSKTQDRFSSQSQYLFIYYIYGEIKIGKHNKLIYITVTWIKWYYHLMYFLFMYSIFNDAACISDYRVATPSLTGLSTIN